MNELQSKKEMAQMEESKSLSIMNKKKSILDAKEKQKISKHGPVYESANKEYHTATLKHTLITEKCNAISKLVSKLLVNTGITQTQCQDHNINSKAGTNYHQHYR